MSLKQIFFVPLGVVAFPFWFVYHLPRLLRLGNAVANPSSYFRVGSAN